MNFRAIRVSSLAILRSALGSVLIGPTTNLRRFRSSCDEGVCGGCVAGPLRCAVARGTKTGFGRTAGP